MTDRAALEREALRVYRRYSTEVVEALGLCPWASRALAEGHVVERVLFEEGETLAAIDSIADDEQVEIALFLYPLSRRDRHDFEHYVASVRTAEEERRGRGASPFAMAAFHPNARPDDATPERLIPFIRRTPDPTIQLVRTSVLERVRGGGDGTQFVDIHSVDPAALLGEQKVPLRERIARQNHTTLESTGIDRVAALMDDIRRDRDRAYAAIGVR